MSLRHPGLLLSRAKRADRDFCGEIKQQPPAPTRDAYGARGVEKEGIVPRLAPAFGGATPVKLWSCFSSRGQGSRCRVAHAGLDLQAAPPPPVGPVAGELGPRCRSRSPAPAARSNRSPGRAHTHPEPPWEPSASSTAAGWPSTAAEKKTASGSSCRPSQLLPSVRPRPSPAAARGSPPASPAAARLPGARQSPG